MQVQAVGCKIVIKVERVEDHDPVFKRAKAAGLALAENHEDRLREQASIDRGEVLEIGPSCSDQYVAGVAVGDMIAFAKYSGKVVTDLENKDEK
jgi:co-chaperonin GroES (HSP10)